MPRTSHSVSHRTPRPRMVLRLSLLGTAAASLVGLSDGGATPPAVGAAGRVDAALARSAPTDVLHVPVPVPVPSRTAVSVAPRDLSPHHAASRSRAVPARPVPRPVRARARWVRPVGAVVVSDYGPRWGGFHDGLDFGASYGAPIRVVGDGVVVDSGFLPGEGGYGRLTLVRHADGVVTAYAHQSRSFVHAGQRVHAADVIGLVGSTGHSTGPHLHFEVRRQVHGGQVDPRPWLRRHGVSV